MISRKENWMNEWKQLTDMTNGTSKSNKAVRGKEKNSKQRIMHNISIRKMEFHSKIIEDNNEKIFLDEHLSSLRKKNFCSKCVCQTTYFCNNILICLEMFKKGRWYPSLSSRFLCWARKNFVLVKIVLYKYCSLWQINKRRYVFMNPINEAHDVISHDDCEKTAYELRCRFINFAPTFS